MLQEEGEVKSAIQETLALLAGCFADIDVTRTTQMEAVIMQNIEKVNVYDLKHNFAYLVDMCIYIRL